MGVHLNDFEECNVYYSLGKSFNSESSGKSKGIRRGLGDHLRSLLR